MSQNKLAAVMPLFEGAITALITPYASGAVATDELQNLMQWQYRNGIRSFVLPGSTAEVLCLEAAEKKRLLASALEFKENHHDVQIIGAVNHSSTAFAVEEAKQFSMMGADALMLTCPPYNRPTQEGLYQHFLAVHNATSVPIIIYDIPKRTGVSMEVDCILRLSQLPRIMGIKDASGDLERPLKLLRLLDKPGFSILSGDDTAALSFAAQGGVGCVSVASNIAPAIVQTIQTLAANANFAEALLLQQKLWPLYEAMYCETNPAPTKYAAYLLGKISSDYCRLPLAPLSENSKAKVAKALQDLGML